jgi:toxin-antitoxin system PIN domain toxin
MKYLLDVSVLLAAIWTAHSRHAEVFSWLADKSIVLCPLSELGFLRISTNRKAVGASMERARELLDRFAAERQADRIPDDLAPLDSHPKTSGEVTDLYLAELAAKHGLRLATLDRGITHSSAELVTLPVSKQPSP